MGEVVLEVKSIWEMITSMGFAAVASMLGVGLFWLIAYVKAIMK